MADSGLTTVQEEGTRQVQRIASYPQVTVSAEGRGVCSHVARDCLPMSALRLGSVRRSTVRSEEGGSDVRRMRRVGSWLIWR